ncbi:MAG: lantibiotic dehydratase [Saprospiraceae bacterium]|nr:lantibiotic dehydratase [Saprospiraceae bacterium]
MPIESIAKFIFSELDVIKFCKSDVKYLEAIYLSSPDLYFEFVKILNGNLKSNKQRNKILLSVTKYLLRMATKCTPFGVLSKSSIGGISQNKIGKQILSDEVQRIVQLDTSLVNKLTKYLQSFPQFRELLNYYPNNTIYRVNNEICFFSCHLDESNSQYSISRIEESDLLDTILNWSKDGIIYKELLGLIRNKFSVQNASSILDGLIDKEFLISDYEKT